MTTKIIPGNQIQHDPQAGMVYSWERDFIETRIGPQIMSREECQSKVRRAAAILRVSEPHIEFLAMPGANCEALPWENKLRIATWGRAHVTLLHEMAHLGSWRVVTMGEAVHGPSFVTCAIQLYSGILGIDVRWLEEKATLRGIEFIPAMVPGLAYHGRTSGDLFEDEL